MTQQADLIAVLRSTQRLLETALERMDRARYILTDGNPRPEDDWTLLNTADLKFNYRALTQNTPKDS